jgi:hypothetical protein
MDETAAREIAVDLTASKRERPRTAIRLLIATLGPR